MAVRAILHEAEEGGYWAEVPSMPGCYTEGDTLDEAKAMVVDAAECWLGGRLQDEIEYEIDPLPR